MEHSNMFTGTVYQGYNQLFLGIESKEGFTNKWATFLQWKQNGFKVKKGSHGVHCRTFVENTRATAKDKNSKVPKWFVLFNEAQVEYVGVEAIQKEEQARKIRFAKSVIEATV